MATYPWCGVPAGQRTPLPIGCGWSDLFTTGSPPALAMTQIADEVTGIAYYGPIAGVVSDYRLNGTSLCTWGGCAPNSQWRISYQMSRDGTQFSGNYSPEWNGSGYYNSACGGRLSTGTTPPATCMGGGGSYDGTWFTNVGVLTLTQPVAPASGFPSTSVTGVWFPWGPNPVEYVIDGGTATPDPGLTLYSALPGQTTLSWVDTSPLGGALSLTAASFDPMGVTLFGQTANGALLCGVDYGTDPFNPSPYGKLDAGTDRFKWNTESIGSLFAGCGMTGNQWTLWPQAPGGSGSSQSAGQLVQTRAAVVGTTDLAGQDSVVGSVAFSGLGTVVSGAWSDTSLDAGGSFIWYLDSQDQTFSGDFTAGPTLDGGASAWCGSSDGATQPSPCLQ